MAGRAPGWGTAALLALACAGLSVVGPAPLIIVPLAVLLIGAPPVRPRHVVLGLVLSALAFQGHARHGLWIGGRGWALLVAAWFLVAVLALPRAAFLDRGLAALAGAAASAAVLLRVAPELWGAIDWTVRASLWAGASDAVAVGGARFGQSPWWPEATEMMYRLAELQARLFPALLALASLAGLAAAWFVYGRVARGESGPLGALREFRFRDELVWLLIVGIVLIVAPLGDAAPRIGANLVAFMGALYAMRGVAVVVALAGTPGLPGVVLATLAAVFLYPLVMAAMFLVGLTDTWLDLRGRTPSRDPGSGESGP